MKITLNRRRPPARRLPTAGLVLATSLLAGTLAVPASAGAFDPDPILPPPTWPIDLTPRCQGELATIWGVGPLYGTDGDDVIVGSAAVDYIDGRGGDDLICGGGARDYLYGRDGHDRIFGGDGPDIIVGGEGGDLMVGEDGADSIDAVDSEMTLVYEVVVGGPGADWIDTRDGITDFVYGDEWGGWPSNEDSCHMDDGHIDFNNCYWSLLS